MVFAWRRATIELGTAFVTCELLHGDVSFQFGRIVAGFSLDGKIETAKSFIFLRSFIL